MSHSDNVQADLVETSNYRTMSTSSPTPGLPRKLRKEPASPTPPRRRCRGRRMNAPTYNFAYLDEQDRADDPPRDPQGDCVIPGYQVPFASRRRDADALWLGQHRRCR